MPKNKLAAAIAPMNSIAGPYRPSAEDKARELRYKAEDALRTVKEYQKIQSDKPLMSAVKKLAKEEMSKLAKVAK